MYKNAVYIQIEVILEWRFNNYCIFSPLPAKAEGFDIIWSVVF
jgi:hypothetical protein